VKKISKRLLKLATVSMAGLYAFNKITFYLATVKHLLPDDNGFYYNWKYGKVFYTKQGSGSPLILIHKIQPESSGQDWNQITEDLSKKHTLYIIDLPGCGRSDKPKLFYTSYFYVQFLESFVQNVVEKPAAICADGNSSIFALHYAALHQQMVTELTLINPQVPENNYISKITAKLRACVLSSPLLGTTIYNHHVSLENIKKRYKESYFYNKECCSEKEINTLYESAHFKGASARYLYASIEAGYMNMPISHILKDLRIPAQIICSSTNPDIDAIREEYCCKMPSIKLHTI